MSTSDTRRVTARRLRLTGRGWALVVVGALALLAAELFGVTQLRFLGLVVLLLPVVMVVTRLIWRPKLEVERAVYPTTVAAGDRIRVIAEVRNQSVLGLESSAYADVVTGTARQHVTGVLPSIASRLHPREGRRRRRIAYGLTRMRRGISQIGPLFLENGDGLGLTLRVISVGEPTEVEVWPHIHDVDQLEIPALRTGHESEVSLGRSGDADDAVTREYRRSDPLRRVHWRATARAGELRVRQEEHHAEVVSLVVFDTSPVASTSRAARPGTESVVDRSRPDSAFELGVSVSASVLNRLHSLGYDTELLETHAFEDEEITIGTSAGESLARVMRHLMLVQPADDAEHDLDGIAQHAARVGTGPLFYVTRAESPIAPDAVDLAEFGAPAVAVLCGNGAPRDSAAVQRFVSAGWQVIWMDSGAADPWRAIQRFGVMA